METATNPRSLLLNVNVHWLPHIDEVSIEKRCSDITNVTDLAPTLKIRKRNQGFQEISGHDLLHHEGLDAYLDNIKDIYDRDSMLGPRSVSSCDPPPVSRVHAIYGINLPTEIGGVYHRKNSCSNPVRVMNVYAPDPKATLSHSEYIVKNGLLMETPKTKQVVAKNRRVSGDGSVPYWSLQHVNTWKKTDREVTVVELTKAEHHGILLDPRLHRELLSYSRRESQMLARKRKYKGVSFKGLDPLGPESSEPATQSESDSDGVDPIKTLQTYFNDMMQSFAFDASETIGTIDTTTKARGKTTPASRKSRNISQASQSNDAISSAFNSIMSFNPVFNSASIEALLTGLVHSFNVTDSVDPNTFNILAKNVTDNVESLAGADPDDPYEYAKEQQRKRQNSKSVSTNQKQSQEEKSKSLSSGMTGQPSGEESSQSVRVNRRRSIGSIISVPEDEKMGEVPQSNVARPPIMYQLQEPKKVNTRALVKSGVKSGDSISTASSYSRESKYYRRQPSRSSRRRSRSLSSTRQPSRGEKRREGRRRRLREERRRRYEQWESDRRYEQWESDSSVDSYSSSSRSYYSEDEEPQRQKRRNSHRRGSRQEHVDIGFEVPALLQDMVDDIFFY